MNDIETNIKFQQRNKLKYVTKYDINKYYIINIEENNLAIISAKIRLKKNIKKILIISAIFSNLLFLEIQFPNGITIYNY